MAISTTANFHFSQKTVAAAGTQEAIHSAALRVRSVLLIAHSTNTGRVYYGGSDVDSSTQKGLLAGESVTITGDKPFDIQTIFIDVDTAGEGVDWIATRV